VSHPQEGEEATINDSVYKVVPNDSLVIDVHDNPELSGSFRVSAEGNILYSILGQIRVAGLSTSEIKDLITVLLEDYIYNPVVNVSIKDQNVYVTGEVKRPGIAIPFESNMTVLKAITLAGGATKRASVKNTIIKRIKEGKEEIIHVQMGDIVQPDDIIEVPLSFW
jgi:polysaccharide export outer membrane protein